MTVIPPSESDPIEFCRSKCLTTQQHFFIIKDHEECGCLDYPKGGTTALILIVLNYTNSSLTVSPNFKA